MNRNASRETKNQASQRGRADESDIINAKAKYRGTYHGISRVFKGYGLAQQRQRVTIADTLKSRKFVDNLGESGIIKARNMSTRNLPRRTLYGY